MMSSYGQTIWWTDRDGTLSRVSVNGFATAEEALAEALATAQEMGWTSPRWWQYWRWFDYRYAEGSTAAPPA